MRPEAQDLPNDPFDDELDAAVLAAAELVVHTKTVGLTALEIPIMDESGIWEVTVKKLGISDED
jgi:hypothetical protein